MGILATRKAQRTSTKSLHFNPGVNYPWVVITESWNARVPTINIPGSQQVGQHWPCLICRKRFGAVKSIVVTTIALADFNRQLAFISWARVLGKQLILQGHDFHLKCHPTGRSGPKSVPRSCLLACRAWQQISLMMRGPDKAPKSECEMIAQASA